MSPRLVSLSSTHGRSDISSVANELVHNTLAVAFPGHNASGFQVFQSAASMLLATVNRRMLRYFVFGRRPHVHKRLTYAPATQPVGHRRRPAVTPDSATSVAVC